MNWTELSSVSECLSTAARRIWTSTCPSSVVFVHPPQPTHLKSVRCAPLTSPWSSLAHQPSSWRGITYPRRQSNNYECSCLTLERAKTYNIADAEVAQVVEQRTENPRVSGPTPLLGTTYKVTAWNYVSSRLPFANGTRLRKGSRPQELARRSGGKVDATVSKTVGGQPPCRFESDLRHQNIMHCRVV